MIIHLNGSFVNNYDLVPFTMVTTIIGQVNMQKKCGGVVHMVYISGVNNPRVI